MTAVYFVLFGINIFTMYIGVITFCLLFIITLYLLGKELGGRGVGLTAMLFAAFPPFYLFKESLLPHGYHVEVLFFGNIILLSALKICSDPTRLKRFFYYALLGVAAGLGFWVHYIVAYYFIPVILYLLINERFTRLIRYGFISAVSVFLSAMPFWMFAIQTNFKTFRFPPLKIKELQASHYLDVSLSHIKGMMGIENAFKSNNYILESVVASIYILAILYFICSTIFRRKAFSNKNIIILYLFGAVIIIYSFYRTKMYATGGYHYMLPIVTFLYIAFASFVKRIRYLGAGILLFAVSFNLTGIQRRVISDSKGSKGSIEGIYQKINFLLNNKIFRYIGDDRQSRQPVFFSRERIVGTGVMNGEYIPHEDEVEAADRIGIEGGGNWRPVLDNICRSYRFDSGYCFYFDFKPHPYDTRVIRPDKWNAGSIPASYAFDRSYDTWWSTGRLGKKTGMSFILDLGDIYNICKISMFNINHIKNFPKDCRLEISLNGKDWAELLYYKESEPLFWSGPRLYFRLMYSKMELFFNPVKTRFIKIVQIGEDKEKPWEINEIFVYEYMGEKEIRLRDYVKDIKDVVRFLEKKEIDFIYTDFWPSARIRKLTNNRIKTLVPFNTVTPPRKYMSREVQLSDKNAFLVERKDSAELEGIFNELELPFRKKEFNIFICYYFKNLDPDYYKIKPLMWLGVGAIKNNLKDYSRWLFNKGSQMELSGDVRVAGKYYAKAVRYYPNNFLAYFGLYRVYSRLGRKDLMPDLKKAIEGRFIPDIRKPVVFKNGIRFLGYKLKGLARPGGVIKLEYFWRVPEEMEVVRGLSVFVYFMKDERIVFQNDHRFLFQYPKRLNALDGEIFREKLSLFIPSDAEVGRYEIILGLWEKDKNKRIHILDPDLKRKSKVTIGELEVVS